MKNPNHKVIFMCLAISISILSIRTAVAQNAPFTVGRETPTLANPTENFSYTEKLEPLSIYVEKMEITPFLSGQMRFTFASLDESKDWASFVYDGRRFTEVSVSAVANRSFLMYFETMVPETFESTQHVLNINIEFVNTTKTIPIYLKPSQDYTIVDNIFINFNNFLSSNVVTFSQDNMFHIGGLTGWMVVVLISLTLIIIVLVKAIIWLTRR